MSVFLSPSIVESTSQAIAGSLHHSSISPGCLTFFSSNASFLSEKLVLYKTTTDLFFGDGFTQDINTIIIKKIALTGLTPSNNNTAESIFVALINRALATKGDTDGKINAYYWGTGFTDGKRVGTIIIQLFNTLNIVDEYEIQDLSDVIISNDY